MFAEVDTTAFVNMSAADQASMMEATFRVSTGFRVLGLGRRGWV